MAMILWTVAVASPDTITLERKNCAKPADTAIGRYKSPAILAVLLWNRSAIGFVI
jgi:hypothetical protein